MMLCMICSCDFQPSTTNSSHRANTNRNTQEYQICTLSEIINGIINGMGRNSLRLHILVWNYCIYSGATDGEGSQNSHLFWHWPGIVYTSKLCIWSFCSETFILYNDNAGRNGKTGILLILARLLFCKPKVRPDLLLVVMTIIFRPWWL